MSGNIRKSKRIKQKIHCHITYLEVLVSNILKPCNRTMTHPDTATRKIKYRSVVIGDWYFSIGRDSSGMHEMLINS